MKHVNETALHWGLFSLRYEYSTLLQSNVYKSSRKMHCVFSLAKCNSKILIQHEHWRVFHRLDKKWEERGSSKTKFTFLPDMMIGSICSSNCVQNKMLAFRRFLGSCHSGRGAQVPRQRVHQPTTSRQTIAGFINEHFTTNENFKSWMVHKRIWSRKFTVDTNQRWN